MTCRFSLSRLLSFLCHSCLDNLALKFASWFSLLCALTRIQTDSLRMLTHISISSSLFFSYSFSFLREKGINRAGNVLIPNNNYCDFERWVQPIYDTMAEEQKTREFDFTPSELIARFGKEIASEPRHEESICYWAYKVCALSHLLLFC